MSLWDLFLLTMFVYWALSLILLLFPNLIWKRHRRPWQSFNILCDANKIFSIGHRGGAREGAENTMECFVKTDASCDMFELDVVQTKDKQPVVHHDHNLQRTCGLYKHIQNIDYKNLPHFQDEFSMHFTTQKGKGSKNRIILLRELFQRFPRKVMNVELKAPTPTSIQQLNRLVREFNREHITVWRVIKKQHEQLKKINKNVQYFYNAKQIVKVYMLYVFGLLPFCSLQPGFFEIPLFTDETLAWFKRIRPNRGCLFCLFTCMVKFINFISGGLIRHLKKRGIPTFYFVLNNRNDYEYAIGKGCSGIMTDKPSDLKQFLIEKKLSF